MASIQILDKKFCETIPAEEIHARISQLANNINQDFIGKEVDFLVVLNGAFMFAARLLRYIKLICRVEFVKIASYQGTSSTGNIQQLVGLKETLTNRRVIILEDIVDSGNTIDRVIDIVGQQKPLEIHIASLLFKSDAYKKNHEIRYSGFNIPNDFIVGYGLDYNGYGRNLDCIYTIINE